MRKQRKFRPMNEVAEVAIGRDVACYVSRIVRMSHVTVKPRYVFPYQSKTQSIQPQRGTGPSKIRANIINPSPAVEERPFQGRANRSPLEPQLEAKLNHARVVHCLTHNTETRLRFDVLHVSGAGSGQEELRMIEQIEKLCAELQIHPFAEV
jgi:hypothetical protein